ncbi:MAG TPA: hypothetical protein VFW03_16145, partial [Gemmatimonadaceae bacterium]|nr:hypothetical protein [Gemmatimonadaceae bacterium]
MRDGYRVPTLTMRAGDARRRRAAGRALQLRSVEDRIPADHPLRAMQALVDPVLAALSPRFEQMYATSGRPS